MFGLRASAQRLRERLTAARDADAACTPSSTEAAAMIAHAVYQRENASQTTTMRQLHQIVEMSQPEAIRTVRDLESAGMVEIAHDITDTLESRVMLTPRMRDRLETILRRNSA